MKPSRTLNRYHGVVVPMVTPFTGAGELDEGAVRRIIDHMVAGGVAGVFVLGTTGEEPSIPLSMRARLVEVAAKHLAGRAVLYAGISSNCLVDAVEAAQEFKRLGAELFVARLPTYYALGSREQGAYFLALADRLLGPLMLYDIEHTTHMTLPLDVVVTLSQHPQIVGIKDSNNDPTRLRALIGRLGGRPDFALLVGSTRLASMGIDLGADGLVPSQGNLVPELCQHLFESAASGDTAMAEKCQQALTDVSKIYQGGQDLRHSLGALKAAMGELGLCGPHVLPPLLPPEASEVEITRRAFREWLGRTDFHMAA